jgi:hypothetical protein
MKGIEPLLDKIAELAERQLADTELSRLLAELGGLLDEGLSVNLTVTVEIYDAAKRNSLPLHTSGLTAFPGKTPFRTWDDTSWQRYVLKRGIVCVPHDRCPQCWQPWDFKLESSKCDHCDLELGNDCKLLIDNDECPWCNEGSVTVSAPRCNRCGTEMDRRKVAWG